MAKAKNSKEYALQWKNEATNILYGPVADCYMDRKLAGRMRDSITKLCGEIDEAAKHLIKEGTFTE